MSLSKPANLYWPFHRGKKSARGRPDYFVFCDRATGLPRFRVESTPEGSMQLDQAASLLAMHCAVRGEAPSDYLVMVPLENDLLSEVTSRATKLLEAARGIGPAVRLSRREREVLTGVVQSLRNKEIASRLCISERTVKFYVSALLAKFQVRSRMALSEAANLVLHRDSWPRGPEEFHTAEEMPRNMTARVISHEAVSGSQTAATLKKSLAARIWRGKLATT